MPAANRTAIERKAWLDYAKAIGITLVVFGHASRSIGRTEGLAWSPQLQTLDAIIYTFHMPLFFLLAGYAAGLGRKADAASFGRALLWGIAVPYFVWSAVWIGLKLAVPDAANVPMTWSDLMLTPVVPVEHMWFLYYLFFMRIGWYVIERMEALGGHRQTGTIIASVVATSLVMTFAPEQEALAGLLRSFAIYGVGLAWLPVLMQQFERNRSLKLVALGAAASIWGLMVPGDGLPALLLPAVGGSLIVIGLAVALPAPSTPALKAFAFLGEASLAIYVMHLIVGAAARVALAKSGLLSEGALLVAATGLGLFLPAIACWIALAIAAATGKPFVRVAGLGTATDTAYLPLTSGRASARAAT